MVALAPFGALGLFTLILFIRHRRDATPEPELPDVTLPVITIQLPIYNERFVLSRLLRSVNAIDYPRSRLQVQVIDDSTDGTSRLAAQLVRQYRGTGLNIEHIQRHDRNGYKAGALQNALRSASGELIALFDADFCPPADYLYRTVPYLLADERLGAVQARWSHLNPDASPLTAMQAIALDKHFAIDQPVRYRANLFPKFNGSAGIWRRACIEDAGGWEHDTLTEDLDLSMRAIFRGWRFHYLLDVTAPAELPNTIAAFKSQQARWAKGTLQCLLKFAGRVATTREQTIAARLYQLVNLSTYFTYPLAVLLLLLQLPMLLLDVRVSFNPFLFSILGLAQPLLYVASQFILYPNGWRKLPHLPATLIIAVGLAANQTRARLSVLLGRLFTQSHPFVRTPKGILGQSAYRLPFDWIVLVELALAGYAALGIAVAIATGRTSALFYLVNCLLGYAYIAFLTLREHVVARRESRWSSSRAVE
jgi:cellulose synthase/poly-beta-1,6-N-acetylglucosamine synthase-like glycosyltransferase